MLSEKYSVYAFTILLPLIMLSHKVYANHYPFYVGVTTGYGSTKWQGLVPPKTKQNLALSMSTPISTSEGGVIWGLFVGYEPFPYFAVEAAYMRYPPADVSFGPESLFTFEHGGSTELRSDTETVSLIGKIMLAIPCTEIKAYSSAGAAGVHRFDSIQNIWHLSPTFGVGLNYNFTENIIGELGASYTAGHGEAELSPAEDYIPFLYAVSIRLAFHA